MSEKSKRRIVIAVSLVFLLILTVLEIFRKQIFDEIKYGNNIYMIATRFVGGAACLLFIYENSSRKMLRLRSSFKSLLVFLPCMVIAVNNFPFITFFSGRAYVDAPILEVLIYALVCLGVGFFEEMAFRGCVFTALLSRRKKRTVDVFWSIVLSSAIFGAIHLVNVFAGASVGSVILQVGYSFLIGGMCSVILIKTSNIWYCVVLHAVYNFAGGVVPECGGGVIWDTPTVVLTTVLAVIVAAYVIYLLVKITPDDIDRLLNDGRIKIQNNGSDYYEVE